MNKTQGREETGNVWSERIKSNGCVPCKRMLEGYSSEEVKKTVVERVIVPLNHNPFVSFVPFAEAFVHLWCQKMFLNTSPKMHLTPLIIINH